MVLMMALIVLKVAGIFCFGSSLLTGCEIEVGIFMVVVLSTTSFCEFLLAKEEKKHEMF